MKKSELFLLVIILIIYSCKRDQFSDTKVLLNNLKVENIQKHEFLFDKDTVIETENKIKIHLKVDDFDLVGDSVVTVEIEEYSKRAEFILNNFPAITDRNKYFEPKLVFSISVLSNSKPVNLKKGKALEITLNEKLKGAKLININKDTIYSQNVVSWSEPKNLYSVIAIEDYGGIWHHYDIRSDSLEIVKKGLDSQDEKYKILSENMVKLYELAGEVHQYYRFIAYETDIADAWVKNIKLNFKDKDLYDDIYSIQGYQLFK